MSVSVGGLFMAGVVPGVLIAFRIAFLCVGMCIDAIPAIIVLGAVLQPLASGDSRAIALQEIECIEQCKGPASH